MDNYFLLSVTLVALFAIRITDSVFIPMRPIYEATGEITPLLGNPFGGGSPEIVKRNTMVHVSNQQKIYNQEMTQRMKAQRKQLRSLEPQDSYLRAYHEQHERFHLDLEQKMLEQMGKNNSTSNQHSVQNSTNVANIKIKNDRENVNPNKINNDELKLDRNPYLHSVQSIRNKRLDVDHIEKKKDTEKPVRSVEYAPGYFLPMKNHKVQITHNAYESPRSSKQENTKVVYYTPVEQFGPEDVSALTSAALKGGNQQNHYSQLAGYGTFGGDIESSLTALIGKQPDDQLKGLTYLLQQSSANHKVTSADLKNTNINLKASAIDVPEEYYLKYEYKSPYATPLNSYQEYVRDHTPITEHVDDVADPRKPPPRLVPLPTTYTYHTDTPAASTSASNYYKVEVASSQVHSKGPESSLYKPAPSYSYTSGHDNVSIEVKDKPDSINLNVKRPNTRYKDRTRETVNDEDYTIVDENMYSSSIPYGAKLHPKKPKTNTARPKRQTNNNRSGFHMFTNTNMNQHHVVKLTPRISNTKPINFTHSSNNNNNKIKTPVTNSFSLNDSVAMFSNNILRNLSSRVNCSECFKSNGESEFYYYEDSSSNETDSQLDYDFPSYDDLQTNKNITQKSKLTLRAHTAGSRETMATNPHSEALRLRFKPRLYRVVNGIKMRVMSPNPARYRKYLIRKPVRFYYSRYANEFNMDYDSRYPLYNNLRGNYNLDQADYGDDYGDEYYDDDEEMLLADDLVNYNKYGKKPHYDPYEEYASQSQYASGFDDYISIDSHQKRNRINGFNRFIASDFPRAKGRYRYASGYEDNSDYINEDVYNDYTRNVRNRFVNRYPLSGNNFDYDYSQNPYLDNYDDLDIQDNSFDKFNRGNRYKPQESQFSNTYSDKGFSDSYGNYYASDFGNNNYDKKKKLDPSNYYVENFNQYVTKPVQHSHSVHETGHQKPISVFNIFRNESPQKQHGNKHKLIDDSDVIHIDNVNVYPHGPHKTGWKGPKKPLHHLPYRPHRPIKHRRRKPTKWRRPRPFSRRSSPKKKYHMITNLSKINRKVPLHLL